MLNKNIIKRIMVMVLLLVALASFDGFNKYAYNRITGAAVSSTDLINIEVKPGWNIISIGTLQALASTSCSRDQMNDIVWAWYPQANDYGEYKLSSDLKSVESAGDEKSDNYRNAYPETLSATRAVWLFNKGEACTVTDNLRHVEERASMSAGWNMAAVQPNWAGNKLSDVLESGCDFKAGLLFDAEKGWLPQGGLTLDYTFTTEDVGRGFWIYVTGGCATKASVKPMTKIVTGCGEITESGDYALGNDITVNEVRHVPEETCLKIHNSDKINLDCKGHSITVPYYGVYGIGIFNVKGFSLKNCILTSNSWSPLFISKSEDGAASDNTFNSLSPVRIKQSNGIAFKKNTFNTMYEQFYSNNNVLQDNDFSPISISVFPGVILFDSGSGNKISDNTIDGKSNGVFNEKSYNNIAADDGIIIKDESGDVIQDNTIVNVWDCGIETDGTVSDTEFSGNTISNAGLCGIGGWYFNSWKNNIVNGNSVSNAPMLFLFFRTWGLRPAGSDELKILPQDDAVYFLNNQFSDNRITDNAKVSPYSVYNKNSAYISITATSNLQGLPGERGVTTKDIIVGNNKFMGNNFGIAKSAPFFNPKDMIVDGGGNTCSKPIDAVYPLNCGNN